MKKLVYQQIKNSSGNDVLLVVRQLLLPAMLCDADVAKIVYVLSSECKVIDIHADVDKQMLSLKYDVSQVQYTHILVVLESAGYGIMHGFLSSIKTAWYEFTETNKRDNANAPPPACCNKPPK